MPTKKTAIPAGPFVVLNPRGIPEGRWIIRDGDIRYHEGDTYTGGKAAMWLERKMIGPKPRKKATTNGGAPS